MTDFAEAEGPSQYWLGTAGNNLYKFDARFHEAVHRGFGLLTPGAGAVALDQDGGLWIGGDGRGPRRGVVRASPDLQEWRQFESGVDLVPPERVEDVLVTSDAAWFASVSGLYRRDRGSGNWAQAGGTVGRMPVRRLASSEDGLWAATDRGLVHIAADGTPDGSFFQGRAVYAVLEHGDAVLVGGAAGLVRMDSDGRVAAPPADATPPPPGPIVDIARDGSDVWAATPDALWRFDGRGWEGPLREAPSALGRVHRLRVTGGALWVTGDGGAARRQADGSGWQYLVLDRDLPAGPVFDVVVTREHVFAATPAGLVRLERRRGY